MQRLHSCLFALLTPALILFPLATGCNQTTIAPSGSTPPKIDADPKPPNEDKTTGSWGDITGQIIWGGGDVPAPKKLDVNKDQEHCLSSGDLFSEEWVINKDSKGVRYCVVWLLPDPPPDPETNPDAKLAVHPKLQTVDKDKKHVMDQPCCMFNPRVVALRQGEILVAKNSSPILHSFKYAGIRIRGDSVSLPAMSELEIKNLKESPFPVVVDCAIHPWMKAYIRIFDHPYFAVTDENGKFEIKNAPAGKCRMVVWQESKGYRTDKNGDVIEIKPGPNDVGKLEIKP